MKTNSYLFTSNIFTMPKKQTKQPEMNVDPADVVLFTYHFMDDYYREQRSFINYIDAVLWIAEEFHKIHHATSWEDNADDWESAVYKFFNKHKKQMLIRAGDRVF